jgi:hypothetical protein
MDLIEDIGPILGVVAFLGFAILALLIVLQAREVRRLREWAGRAPERAVEADDAALAASEEKGELKKPEKPSRPGALRSRVGAAVGPRWDALDRRSPIDPRILVVALVALIVAGVPTSGFGLIGGSDGETPVAETQNNRGGNNGSEELEVAVLNATEQVGVAEPVPGIAGLIADEVVKPNNFKAGVRTDAPAGEEDSLILFEPEAEADAEELAAAVESGLGETPIEPMSEAVRDQIEGAPLALLVGFDDASFGADAAP